MTTSDMGHTTRQPVAMFRGIFPHWYLYDGSPGRELHGFFGSYVDAHAQAEEWCAAHGYHLSKWSDADDRVPRSDCICDPWMGDQTTPGCPMHRPAESVATTNASDEEHQA